MDFTKDVGAKDGILADALRRGGPEPGNGMPGRMKRGLAAGAIVLVLACGAHALQRRYEIYRDNLQTKERRELDHELRREQLQYRRCKKLDAAPTKGLQRYAQIQEYLKLSPREKFEVHQALTIGTPNDSYNAVEAVITLPNTPKDSGVSFLINAVTDNGNWYQLGIDQRYDLDSYAHPSIVYEVWSGKGLLLKDRRAKGSGPGLKPQHAYDLELRFDGGAAEASVRGADGRVLFDRQLDARGAKSFVGGVQYIPDGIVFTGLMTETSSTSAYRVESPGSYEMVRPNPKKISALAFGSEVLSPSFVAGTGGNFPASKAYYISNLSRFGSWPSKAETGTRFRAELTTESEGGKKAGKNAYLFYTEARSQDAAR